MRSAVRRSVTTQVPVPPIPLHDLLGKFSQLGAAAIPDDAPFLSMDDLADQVAEVLDFFEYGSMACLSCCFSPDFIVG